MHKTVCSRSPLSILLTLTITVTSCSQSTEIGSVDVCGECPTLVVDEEHVIYTQDELDLLDGVTETTSYLSLAQGVDGSTDLDLSPLSCLREAQNLAIVDLPLANLQELECLHRVSTLSIVGDIESMEGLDALAEVDYFEISFAFAINNLSGLNALETVNSALIVQSCNSLESLEGINPELAHINRLIVAANENLASLEGLPASTSITGGIIIDDNPALQDINALLNTNVEMTDGYEFSIVDNQNLPTCQAEALASRVRAQGYTGEIEISGNDDSATCE